MQSDYNNNKCDKKHWQHGHRCGSVFGYGFLPKGIHLATQNNQQEAS